MINVIIYARVSSDEQAKGTSLEVQEERIRRYCDLKGYNVLGTYREDESAKTFEKRPEMMKIMDYVKKHSRKVQKLLFLRWDRFSRDIISAPKYLKWFLDRGVEPNAIECELDFTSEGWPLMLGVQIGLAQGDNIKRSKATMDGIYGTLKSGRWSNKAPRGYKNVTILDNDKKVIGKTVEIDTTTSPIIKEAFVEVARGLELPCSIRRRLCPHIPEQSFLDMLKNPFYMGKVRVPERDKQPSYLVDGVHEPLIDEKTFNDVQEIMSGKRRGKRFSKREKPLYPDLYLRGYLVCPVCGRALTGSYSKGRNGRYPYYHCSRDGKHSRTSAQRMNSGFEKFVGGLVPNQEVLNLYKAILKDAEGENDNKRKSEIHILQNDIEKIQVRIDRVNDMYFDGEISRADRETSLQRYQSQIEDYKNKIEAFTAVKTKETSKKIKFAMSILANLGDFLHSAPVELRKAVVGSMFCEKIVFDGENYRTASYNKVLDLIFKDTKRLRGAEIEKSGLSEENPDSVP